MPNWIALFLALFVACTFVKRADAQQDQIEGAWQQIESSAGACPRCRISIDQRGASFTVAANNGWSANIVIGEKSDSIVATGTGRWRASARGTTADKRFDIDFRLRDQRLYMSMRVDLENGSRRLIKAVFGRIWIGA